MNLGEEASGWLPFLYLVISMLVTYLAYRALGIALSRLRLRGIISRRFEESIKLLGLAVIAAIVIPAAISTMVPHPLVPTISVAVSMTAVVVVLTSIIGYISNSLSYLVIALTSAVRDGEYIRVLIDGKEYEGRVMLVEGNYMVLRSEPGVSVMIPYSRLLKSVIVKISQLPLAFKIRVTNPGSDVGEVVSKVTNAIKKMKLINKATVSVRPLEISEDELVLVAEIEILNPRNVDECFGELVKLLMRELPYRVSIEVLSGRQT